MTDQEKDRIRKYLAMIRRKEILNIEEARDFNRLISKLWKEHENSENLKHKSIIWDLTLLAGYVLGVARVRSKSNQ